MSMPNIMLLMPIAEALGVTVTELLRGEKIDAQKNLDANEIEGLVVGSLDLSLQSSIHRKKRNWIFAYLLCVFCSIVEIMVLLNLGISFDEMKENVLLITGFMYLFGGWFCLFAKDMLDPYYDENKINYVTQGIFRIHLVGLSFHNGNWPHICTTLKIWSLATAVFYPLAGILTFYIGGTTMWFRLEKFLLIVALGGILVSTYVVGKKYE